MTAIEAAEKTMSALVEASGLEPSASGTAWILTWFLCPARCYLIEQEPALVEDLCNRIASLPQVGKHLRASAELMSQMRHGAVSEVEPELIASLEPILRLSGTRLCM